MQNPLTFSAEKHKSPLDIIRSFQKKSQFRTIAPKMLPKILTSGVISCLQSSLPEQNTPISAAGSKLLVVPTQNYAVMQVAGHEGTFSLLPLPCVAPALLQQVQRSNVSPSENLKLPIPVYQPVRNKLLSDKKRAQISVLGVHKISTKALISSQTSPMTTLAEECPETHSSSNSTEQVMLTDRDSAEIAVATLVNKSNCVESESPLVNKTEITNGNVSGPSVVKDSLSKPTSIINLMKLSLLSVKTASETTRESFITSGRLKKKPTNSANSVAVLSPAIFGSTIQMTPSAPKGKLPILPYSRVKNSVFCKSKQTTNIMDLSGPSLKSECEMIPALVKAFHVPTKVWKRRVPDDVLAFQTKRRKCIISKFREGRERMKVDLQPPEDKKAGMVKKYRSIRPKPVVLVQTSAPLTAAATVETPSLDHLDQDSFLNRSLPNKYLSYKHSDAASAKSIDLSRNACSIMPKPLHKCHVCNRTFRFKHNLQDHMNTHTNKRPYSCRICRKAYIHSGSLSRHMKLHHNEGRSKKRVCCEFCAKVFGHAKVYFGHLREVHRVVISTEPSTSEQQMQDALKKRDTNIKEAEEAMERGNKCNFEDLFHNPGEVKLQIKCGQCQFIAQSFGEIKFHLLCSHGEEIQGRVKEGVLQGNRGA
ncbi:zinc finger protein 438 [Podargus strigoides]